MFLIEKYTPRKLADFRYNYDVMNLLQFAATKDDIPHFIITGEEGSGKKIIARFLLEAIYGESIHNVKRNRYNINATWKSSGATTVKNVVEMDESRYHIVIDASNSNKEKHIIHEIIKQFATRGSFNSFFGNRAFKTVVIYNIERLAGHSQAALRRTMEKYASACRFLMVCNNISNIIEPLRSRCSIVTVQKPSMQIIRNRIQEIVMLEDAEITPTQIKEIMKKCDQSMSKAIWILDCLILGCSPDLPIDDCFELIFDIIFDKDDCIMMYNEIIRQQIYDILITDLSATDIINRLVDMCIEKIDDDKILKRIITVAAEAEYNSVHGRRESLHIDAVVWSIIQSVQEIV